MADDPNAAQPAPDDPNAQLAVILKMLGPQQSYAPPAPVDRSTVSLLGEALGGGTTGLSPADREAAGTRALLNFGTNMMAASGPSVMPRSFGQIFGQGVGGAEQSLASSEEVSAARLAAQQQYAEKEQELRINALREAIPLLQLQQVAAGRKTLLGQTTPSTSVATSAPGSIGAPVLARDTSMTAGQQGNNPGNVSVTPGSPLPAGASAAIPVAGGKYVAAFPDVPTGVAAHSDTLNSYAGSGVNTIRAAVTKWVGDPNVPKATMDSYVADVAKAAGVDPDATIDLTDPKVQRAFILAQQPHESGKAWLSPGDVDTGLALATARRQGRPGGPATAAAPQGAPVPAPTATAPAAKPGTPALPVPPVPPVITDQTGGDQVAGPGAPSVARVRAVSPAVPGDVNAIIRGITGAGADQTTLAPPGAPAPTVAPAPAVVAGAGVPTATPAAPATTPPAPGRVPDTFTPVRVPLPPDVQHRIDSPETPDMLQAYRTQIGNAVTTEQQQAAIAARQTAIDKARAEAIAQGEAIQTQAGTQQQETWKVLRAEQAAKDTAAAKAQVDADAAARANVNTQINGQRADVLKADQTQLDGMRTTANSAEDTVKLLDIMRSVEKGMPPEGSTFYRDHASMIDSWLPRLGMTPDQIAGLDNRGLFQKLLGGLAVQMSQKTAVGPGTARSVEVQSNLAGLPDQATDHMGRLKLMGFIQNMAQDQINRADEADDYYYRTPNPNKDLNLNQSLYKFPQYYSNKYPSIIPRAPAGMTNKEFVDWAQQNVKPGMVYEAPIYKSDPVMGTLKNPKTGKPIVDHYELQPRLDDQ